MNKLFLLIVTIAVFASCKNNSPKPVKKPSDSLLVSTIKFYESPDSDITTYAYDDSNRVVEKVDRFDAGDAYVYDYTYDSNNNLIQLKYTVPNSGYKEVFSIAYSNNQPDHVNSLEGLYCSYVIKNDRISEINYSNGEIGYYDYSDNNIVFSATKYIPQTPGGPDSVSTNYKFGNKNGPFKNYRPDKWVLGLPGELGGEDIEYDQNDMIGFVSDNQNVQFQITYNSQNYPTSVIINGTTSKYSYINAK